MSEKCLISSITLKFQIFFIEVQKCICLHISDLKCWLHPYAMLILSKTTSPQTRNIGLLKWTYKWRIDGLKTEGKNHSSVSNRAIIKRFNIRKVYKNHLFLQNGHLRILIQSTFLDQIKSLICSLSLLF